MLHELVGCSTLECCGRYAVLSRFRCKEFRFQRLRQMRQALVEGAQVVVAYPARHLRAERVLLSLSRLALVTVITNRGWPSRSTSCGSRERSRSAPGAELRTILRHQRADIDGKMRADIDAADERIGVGVAPAAEAVGDVLAAPDLAGMPSAITVSAGAPRSASR